VFHGCHSEYAIQAADLYQGSRKDLLQFRKETPLGLQSTRLMVGGLPGSGWLDKKAARSYVQDDLADWRNAQRSGISIYPCLRQRGRTIRPTFWKKDLPLMILFLLAISVATMSLYPLILGPVGKIEMDDLVVVTLGVLCVYPLTALANWLSHGSQLRYNAHVDRLIERRD
jgi:hypothetical protein